MIKSTGKDVATDSGSDFVESDKKLTLGSMCGEGCKYPW